MKAAATHIALITGGAGFIGSNLAARLLAQPEMYVRIFDNLSRTGVANNLAWLKSLGAGRRLEIIEADVRDRTMVRKAAKDATDIYHLAAQVAVTHSLEDPLHDFEVNAAGTLNVLEGARASGKKPFFLFTSTNKVYGSLEHVPVVSVGSRYQAVDPEFGGVREDEPLDFHSPYGCSKGTADQYVRDYARIYDLPTAVFRMSCIAGPRQFGNEDQGWVAHFLYSVLCGDPITIYGDGYQVRDVLHVYDLIDAMLAARKAISRTRGEIFNLGGGPSRVVSVMEMLQQIENLTKLPLNLDYSAVRPGDQPLYVSDTTKLQRYTGWTAQRSVAQILQDIRTFWNSNREAITAHSRFSGVAESNLQAQEVA